MNEIVSFLLQHWQLSALFAALIVAYIIFEVKQDPGSKEVSVEQAVALYNHDGALLLDIRSKDDYAQGHIVGAVHLDMDHFESKLKKLQKYIDKPIIVVCNAGKQSAKVIKNLRAAGFTDAVGLSGGVHAWQAAGIPLTNVASKTEL